MTASINQFGININAASILKSFILVLVFCFVSTDSFAQFKRTIPISKYKLPKTYQKQYKIPHNISITKPNCPDLAVMPIQFRKIGNVNPYVIKVRVTAVVKNIGGQDYISGRNQQSIQMYVGRQLVSNIRFTNMAAGASRTISYDMNFSLSNEFPPMIQVMISQDPDIRLDGNTKNDECKTSNNRQRRSSHEIHSIL